ncbi:hypothetical protein TSOC_012007 [Tetrabaena socialis]|uniref:Uncharacterized protein n=1 Tax=Tetrabaena socialis TaxID=47790 RepID=A0A2J7ZP42_9CHLO|nr:hypothetical protein TSOC_012007 [Tetrabaena socialis]|eukprot:PNH02030.1 hypothetical protein TSOC_012007 [Tetrabaena socialis]
MQYTNGLELILVYACQQDSINLDLDAVDCSQELARLTEYTLSPASGTASARRLSEVVGDFPVVNPSKPSTNAASDQL